MSIWGFSVFRIWYLDFVKAILICLIYGNPDRVWSCLREARGDQDGMVGCQGPSSSILVPPLLVAPMINDRTHQCFHIISDQTRNLNSSPKHKYPRLFTFCGKLKKNRIKVQFRPGNWNQQEWDDVWCKCKCKWCLLIVPVDTDADFNMKWRKIFLLWK